MVFLECRNRKDTVKQDRQERRGTRVASNAQYLNIFSFAAWAGPERQEDNLRGLLTVDSLAGTS